MASANYGEDQWHKFEAYVTRKQNPEAFDDFETEAYLHEHLNSQWNDLPQDFKRDVVPPLVAYTEALEKYVTRKNAVGSAEVPPITAYQEWPPHLLDRFATAEERMACLHDARQALEEMMLAAKNLRKARDAYSTRQWITEAVTAEIEEDWRVAESDKQDLEKLITELMNIIVQYRIAEDNRKRGMKEIGGPVGAGWVGAWRLGQGAFGTADLYVRQDSDGMVVDRIVIKDARMSDHMQNDDSAYVLHDGVYVPVEVRAPQLLAGREGSENVLHVRGWREFRDDRSFFRILLEFCPFGDLLGLRDGYGPASERRNWNPKLPVAFLWHTFECLATAGALMEKATRGDYVLHSDIKLENIMLGSSSANRYSGYPIPKLADFGLAVIAPQGSSITWRGHTRRNHPPENGPRYITKDGSVIRRPKANSRSDVWSVGNIIRCLMSGDGGSSDFDFYHNKEPIEPDITPYIGHFPKELLDLVASCMSYHAEDRPTFAAVLRRIRGYTGQHRWARMDLVKGLRSAPASAPRWTDDGVQLRTQTDRVPMYAKLMLTTPGEDNTVAAPPRKGRRLSTQPVYKGPPSADYKSVGRGGPVRKHAADGHTRASHERYIDRLRKQADMEQKYFQQRGGVNNPDQGWKPEGSYPIPDPDPEIDIPDSPPANRPRTRSAGVGAAAEQSAPPAPPRPPFSFEDGDDIVEQPQRGFRVPYSFEDEDEDEDEVAAPVQQPAFYIPYRPNQDVEMQDEPEQQPAPAPAPARREPSQRAGAGAGVTRARARTRRPLPPLGPSVRKRRSWKDTKAGNRLKWP